MGTLPDSGKGVRMREALVKPPQGNCVAFSDRKTLPSSIRGRGQTNSKCAWDNDSGTAIVKIYCLRKKYVQKNAVMCQADEQVSFWCLV